MKNGNGQEDSKALAVGRTTCGSFGGETQKGKPCLAAAGHGTATPGEGRCKAHIPSKLKELKALKKQYLAYLHPEADLSAAEAAHLIGVSVVTVHNWRHADPEFHEAVIEAMEQRDSRFLPQRAARLAESMYRRGLAGKAAPAENIFLLKNWDPDNYKDSRRIEGGGPGGSFVFQFMDPGIEDDPSEWEERWANAESIDASVEETKQLEG